MGKILNAFANDQLSIGTAKRTPQHQRLCDKSNRLMEELKQKLQGEELETFNTLMETMFAESYCAENSMFQNAYRLGVLMTMEVFEDYESLLGKE